MSFYLKINMFVIDELSVEAQRRCVVEILEKMSDVLNNDQLMELNRVLNNEINRISLHFKKEDININYEIENEYAVKDFFKAKKIEGCSNRTIDTYKKIFKSFFKYISKHYTQITSDDVREYLVYYQSINDCSNVTLDIHRRSLNSLFNWWHNNEYIFINPMIRIKKIIGQKQVKKAFTAYEIEKLRFTIDHEDMRTRAVFELLLSSGIRIGEMIRLNISDIDFNNLTFIVKGKGNKERICYFDEKAKLYLIQYLKSRNDESPALFVTKKRPHSRICDASHERILRELGKKAGIDKVHPHRFRRTCATRAINRGMPLEQVQQLLGHESISTTMVYVNVDKNAVKLNHKKFMN